MSRHAELLAEIAALRKQQLKALADAVFIPMTAKQIVENEERGRRIESLLRELEIEKSQSPNAKRKSKIS